MRFDEIMDNMLTKVPDDIDKREGSIIWHTIAPVAAMLAELWVYGDNIHNASIPDNDKCGGEILTRKCAEHGVNRYPATNAVRRGIFASFGDKPAIINIGDVFAAEGIGYTAFECIKPGEYKLQCRQPGIIGNNYFGAVLPLESSHQLGSATLGEVLVPGEEVETDQALRTRFYREVNALPFGGNVDQYQKWLLDIPGVGNAEVFPTPDQQGGRVHCVVVDPNNGPISSDFIDEIQQMLDPEPHGKGLGTAPIGHHVTVSTVDQVPIEVTAKVLPQSGVSIGAIATEVQNQLSAYLARLSFADSVVRVSQVEAAILTVDGVQDIAETTINGQAANIRLAHRYDCFEVPILGTLTLTEG